MASETDICNAALAHLGDAAAVSSIDPPDPSAQAEHCARFYPIARDALLERHLWSFAAKRVSGSLLSVSAAPWLYAYALPPDCLRLWAVLDPTVHDQAPGSAQATRPFLLESQADGSGIVLTDQADAVLRYTRRMDNTDRFSPLFVECLGWSLASMLAGPIVKGDAGRQEAARCNAIAFGQDGRGGRFGAAVVADAGSQRSDVRERHTAPWIAAR